MIAAVRNEELIVKKAKGVMFNFNVRLSANARLLYVALLVAEEGKPLAHKDLMEVTGIGSRSTVIKGIKELVEVELITVKKTQHGQFYTIL